jgi:hypothetical protein
MCRIRIQYSVDMYPLSIRKEKIIGYWGRYVLGHNSPLSDMFWLAQGLTVWSRLARASRVDKGRAGDAGRGSRAAVTKGAAWAGARPGGARLGGVEQVGRGQAGGAGRGWSWAGAARCEEEEARVSG